MPDTQNLTRLLVEWQQGNRGALDALTPVVYQELRRLAGSYLRRERPDHTLQPTALINEAYLRLVDQNTPQFRSRSHFFGVASQLMRQILVDHARAHRAAKRGGDGKKISLDDAPVFTVGRSEELLALDEALSRLAAFDQRKARVIEMRFFGGLSIEQVAQALDISVATVGRELRMAQAWLFRAMNGEPAS